MAKNIFRKSLLDKLSSPEQLDKMIVITPSSFWIALLGGALIIVVALLWGIWGELPEKVEVSGMYLSKEETSVISSEVSGIVKEVYVKNGDTVSEGDSLFTIDTESLKEEKEKLEKRLDIVQAITLDSDKDKDVANSDTQNLLNIKTQITSSYSNPQFAAYLVLLGKYQDAYNNTNQCLETMKQVYELYNEAAQETDAGKSATMRSEIQLTKDTLNRLNALIDYYIADEQAEAALKEAKEALDQATAAKTAANAAASSGDAAAAAQYEQAQAAYDAAKTAYDAAQVTSDAAQAQLIAAQAACKSLDLQGMDYSTIEGAQAALTPVQDKYDNLLLQQQSDPIYEENLVLQDLKSQYEVAESNYNNALSVETSYESSLASYEASSVSQQSSGLTQAKAYAEQFSAAKGALVDQLQKEIDKYEKQLTDSLVKAPSAGTVGNLNVSKGQAVQEGAEILSLREGDENDYAVFYVAPSSGYKIHPGMKANIYPTTINRQEYGHINGIVSSVSDYVVTDNEILSKVGDSSLVSSIKADGPVLEITCELTPDESTASGYEWSTKNGADVELAYGTVLSAEIITDEKQPISLLLPYLKEKMENMTTVKED